MHAAKIVAQSWLLIVHIGGCRMFDCTPENYQIPNLPSQAICEQTAQMYGKNVVSWYFSHKCIRIR